METGGPLYGGAVTRHFQAVLERASLPRQRFHDLRHAAASFMLAQGELQREATEWVSALLWAEK